MLDKLFKAIEIAAFQHRFQFRKGKIKVPYINHPLEVASTIVNIGKVDDFEVLAAAILHDTIEDTIKTEKEFEELKTKIVETCGQEVFDIVIEVSDDKSLPKEIRKKLQIEKALYLSKKAKIVKLADKICNIKEIAQNPPEGWDEKRILDYFVWAEKVVAGLREANELLENHFFETLKEVRQKYNI